MPLTWREDCHAFPDGAYPARTTAIVQSLPRPNFLLEIEATAVLA